MPVTIDQSRGASNEPWGPNLIYRPRAMLERPATANATCCLTPKLLVCQNQRVEFRTGGASRVTATQDVKMSRH